MIYRIALWDEVFEKSDTRKVKRLSWISLPVDFMATGYQEMLNKFGDESPAVYGAWCALCCYASQMPIRGTLANNKGEPVKLGNIARTIGFPASLLQKLVEWASSDEIGWLLIDENDVKTGDSDDAPSALPAISQDATSNLPARWEPQYSTLQDSTEHKTTTTREEPKDSQNDSDSLQNALRGITEQFEQAGDRILGPARGIDPATKLDGKDLTPGRQVVPLISYPQKLDDTDFVNYFSEIWIQHLSDRAGRTPTFGTLQEQLVWLDKNMLGPAQAVAHLRQCVANNWPMIPPPAKESKPKRAGTSQIDRLRGIKK